MEAPSISPPPPLKYTIPTWGLSIHWHTGNMSTRKLTGKSTTATVHGVTGTRKVSEIVEFLRLLSLQIMLYNSHVIRLLGMV
jgi:hypothetical protein